MMNEKTRRTAEKFNIIDKVEKLQRELLQIDGVIDVEFDIDGFYDNIGDFIFLTKYDIPVTLENYFEVRRQLKQNVIEVAKNNGLRRSGDAIEDHGTWFYFVFLHDETWEKV